MKKTILILSFLFFLSCKKENNPILGKWNHIATFTDGNYIPDEIGYNKTLTFNENGSYILNNSDYGTYIICGNKLIMDGNINTVIFKSRMMYINNTDIYFKSN